MTTDERNYLIDNLKGILIILVVLGHGLENLRKSIEVVKIIYVFIYLFHMPMFVFISGYLSKNIEKGRKNAVKNLLIPYIFFNVIWGILQLISYFFVKAKTGDVRASFFTILTPGWGMWYILSMFWWRMFLPDVIKIKRIFIFSILIGILWRFFSDVTIFMSLSRTFGFLTFFLAGYYTSAERIQSIRNFKKIPTLFMLIIGFTIAIIFVRLNIPAEFLWADRSYGNFNLSISKCIVLDMFRYIVGFMFIYAFVNLTPKHKTFLSKLGKNTMCTYLLHTYMIGTLMGFSFFIKNNYIMLAIMLSGVFIVTFLLSRDKISNLFSKFLDALNDKIFAKHNIK